MNFQRLNLFSPDGRNAGGKKVIVDLMYNHKISLPSTKSMIKEQIISIKNSFDIKDKEIF